jgi:hypothetical protein
VAKEHGIDIIRQRLCQKIQILFAPKICIEDLLYRKIQCIMPAVAAANGIHIRTQLG